MIPSKHTPQVKLFKKEWEAGTNDTSCITWCKVVWEIAEVSRKLMETLIWSTEALWANESKISWIPQEITSVDQLRDIISNVVTVIRSQQEENKRTTEQVQWIMAQLEAENHNLKKDKLTWLLNRHTFGRHFSRLFESFNSENEPFCITTIDIDHFKSINDEYTHVWGDAALRFISKVLLMAFKEEEVFRFGWEEFVLLTQGSNSEVANRLKFVYSHLQKNAFIYKDKSKLITFSWGIAIARKDDNAANMLERSDVNMYKAKQAWRWRVFTD